MADSHMLIQNVILMKRYVRHLLFEKTKMTVEYTGGNKKVYYIEYEPSPEEVSAYEAELEDRE